MCILKNCHAILHGNFDWCATVAHCVWLVAVVSCPTTRWGGGVIRRGGGWHGNAQPTYLLHPIVDRMSMHVVYISGEASNNGAVVRVIAAMMGLLGGMLLYGCIDNVATNTLTLQGVFHSDTGALRIDGATALISAVVNGNSFLFVRSNDAINVFSVADSGALVPVDALDGIGVQMSGAGSLAIGEVRGSTYLFVAAEAPRGMRIFSVADSGMLTIVDGGDASGVPAQSVATAEVNGAVYLFASGYANTGVGVFLVAGNGASTAVAAGEGRDIFAQSVSTAVVNGVTVLFVAGARGEVSVFSVAEGGALMLSDRGALVAIDGGGGIPLLGDSASADEEYVLATAVVGGALYLFVAMASGAVSVFLVDDDTRMLTLRGSIIDDDTLNLSDIRAVTTAEINGAVYLFVALYEDDEVAVFLVTDGGGLALVDVLIDDGVLNLDGASSVATATVGQNMYLFATGFEDNGVSVLRLQ